MRTSRPVAEKLGTVRQDPDLHGLLFTLISRATGGRQERAARADRLQTIGEGRGLTKDQFVIAHHDLARAMARARVCARVKTLYAG